MGLVSGLRSCLLMSLFVDFSSLAAVMSEYLMQTAEWRLVFRGHRVDNKESSHPLVGGEESSRPDPEGQELRKGEIFFWGLVHHHIRKTLMWPKLGEP